MLRCGPSPQDFCSFLLVHTRLNLVFSRRLVECTWALRHAQYRETCTIEGIALSQQISMTTVVVKDYDEAIDFYVNKLGFSLIEDTVLSSDVGQGMDSDDRQEPKRWVIVSPQGSQCKLLLARASKPEEMSRIGNQTGGRVFQFLFTDDFWLDYNAYRSRGVEFVRGEPRVEAYGTVAVFSDLYGNLWDLIERS